jgi:NADH-quinone oxidoreductase subunit A
MGEYLPVVALLAVCALFGGISIIVSRIFNVPRPTSAKVAPYECGITDITAPPERFPVRFYLIAMIFIVFDIEIIFLYPFAMIFRGLGAFGLIAITIFAAAVFESFLYLIANGALDWGPIKRLRHSHMVDSTRTARTTVRRVGLEGRDHETVISSPIVDADHADHHEPVDVPVGV